MTESTKDKIRKALKGVGLASLTMGVGLFTTGCDKGGDGDGDGDGDTVQEGKTSCGGGGEKAGDEKKVACSGGEKTTEEKKEGTATEEKKEVAK